MAPDGATVGVESVSPSWLSTYSGGSRRVRLPVLAAENGPKTMREHEREHVGKTGVSIQQQEQKGTELTKRRVVGPAVHAKTNRCFGKSGATEAPAPLAESPPSPLLLRCGGLGAIGGRAGFSFVPKLVACA